ncbi:hypothetical protein [Corticibacter populi]|nr:hypothetical protein [Corticibacter populi]
MTAAVLAALLAGCSTAPTRVEIQRVNVAVPVQCQEPVPQRPQMPTEALPADADVDQYVQAAGAEIERREGYELLLRTALDNCRQPLQ